MRDSRRYVMGMDPVTGNEITIDVPNCPHK